MYQLLATFIAIGLLGVLAAAGMYYMGSVTIGADYSSQASTLTAQSSQIVNAAIFYTVESAGISPPTLNSLVASQYLNRVPSGWAEPPAGSTLASYAVTGPDSFNVCVAYNARFGIHGVPSCAQSAGSPVGVCCQ